MKVEKPIVIINDTIIGSSTLLNKIQPEKIVELNIFNEKKFSNTCLFIQNVKYTGILMAKINHEINFKTQRELNSFFGLNEENDVYVNGYLIEHKNQHISSESIIGIELLKADNFKTEKPVLNVKIE
ncbi:hypothetical protein [Mesonia sp. HuA40]|uniref:hypothetical protein n=1 Tax=Mesonia sp. HuA40 TaxID=2602761 RepID=UPI0021050D8E|nr:hypothetical protein [Mesonia sp. HuA40]